MDFNRKVAQLKLQQGRPIMALVTGASSGMGLMYAQVLAKAGCDLLIVSNQEKEIVETASRLSADFGVKVLPLYQDLALDNAAQSLFDYCACNGLIIDILINNAGMFFFHELDKAHDQKMETMLNLHVMTLTRLCRLFGDEMKNRRFGYILNISSMNAYIPLTKIPAYSAAKAGISNFTQWLATHFAGTGIRCNAIAPGFLVSNQNRGLLFNPDGTLTARSAKILNGTPTGRFVASEELLGAVLFLCDDRAASAITGVVLPIDAGFSAYSGV